MKINHYISSASLTVASYLPLGCENAKSQKDFTFRNSRSIEHIILYDHADERLVDSIREFYKTTNIEEYSDWLGFEENQLSAVTQDKRNELFEFFDIKTGGQIEFDSPTYSDLDVLLMIHTTGYKPANLVE